MFLTGFVCSPAFNVFRVARLLPAFDKSPTGIPHPRVNLRWGVPKGARTDTCTAGAGSLVVEFGILSRLTGDPTYESVAKRAMLAIWDRRDRGTDLLGSTIDAVTGDWIDMTSGVGAGIDSCVKAFRPLAVSASWH